METALTSLSPRRYLPVNKGKNQTQVLDAPSLAAPSLPRAHAQSLFFAFSLALPNGNERQDECLPSKRFPMSKAAAAFEG